MGSIFYLGRHGMTNDDLEGKEKVSGWLEVPLNAEGRSNACRAGRFLKGKGLTSITSSDTKRAIQTAEIIGDEVGVPIVESEKLRSWNMGSLQGMYIEAAKPFLQFFQEHPELKPPKGGSFGSFYRTFKGVWTTTVNYVRKFPDARPLLLTHSQDIDLCYWFIQGVELGKQLKSHSIRPGGIVEVRIDENEISLRQLKG